MSGPATARAWTGDLVRERLGITLATAPGSLVPVEALVGLAVRRNPRRAQLLVSRVLAKHVPTPPGLAIGAGRLLGAAVAVRLGLPWDAGTTACGSAGVAGAEGLAAGGRALEEWLSGSPPACREVLPLPARPPAAGRALATIGYAETATGLGHLVAEFLGSYYVHSTRAAVAVRPYGAFEEEHSHATSHQLTPTDPGRLSRADAVVLVDDELSTGQTVLNTVRELHASWRPAGDAETSDGGPGPRRYVVATLVDLRSDADRARFEALGAELACELSVVALAEGRISLPADLQERSAAWLAEVDAAGPDLAGRRPYLGGTSPHLGGPGPHLGAPAPHLGGTSPHLGAPAPHPGAPAPHLGGTPPGLGGRVSFVAAPGAGGGAAPGIRSARFGVDTALPSPPAGADAPDSPPAAGEPALDLQALEAVDLLREILASVPRDGRVLVLGSEEHLALPLAVAEGLASERDAPGSATVLFSSTTRSPVLAQDDPGYAIRSAVRFASHDHAVDGVPGTGLRFAYNLATPGEEFDVVVYVPEPGTPRAALETPGGPGTAAAGQPSAVEALGRVARHVVVLEFPAAAPFPEPLRGPQGERPAGTGPAPGAFGSYPAEDVGWLLTDLSGAALEAPTHVREAAIQSGRASYAESLPHEYEPSPEYRALFREALAESGGRIAEAVASVTEQVLALRGGEPVLVSLARAGTPVGILMRRWARQAHGIDVPHYTMSIVRGLGIDTNALRFLLTRHRPEQIMFVDGWTGKGAIARELAAAVAEFTATDLQSEGVRLSPELAVLADPGHCVRVFGTRDDFLIPSACLNSTVSGLVSRTVYNRSLIGPHDYHGAKFYRELADGDLSNEFVEAVAACFPAVPARRGAEHGPGQDTEPTWAGWAAVERIAAEHGFGHGAGSVNLVKPGVGETTRVLLRRVPWKVLARPEMLARDADGRLVRRELAHVLLLAEQRGVPVEPVEGLPYSCVGLIHPKYTPGATGADGKTVLDV